MTTNVRSTLLRLSLWVNQWFCALFRKDQYRHRYGTVRSMYLVVRSTRSVEKRRRLAAGDTEALCFALAMDGINTIPRFLYALYEVFEKQKL